MSVKIRENYKYAEACVTSMGVRITPEDRMAVHNSDYFYLQATSAESNVLNVASSLGMPCLVMTKFVEGSPIAAFIKAKLRARNISFEGPDVPQGGPWGYRHQFNIADSGFGMRAPRVWNDSAGEIVPEIGTQIEVYKLKEFYYVKSRTGSVKIALDLSSLFFMTYCADSVNFQTKILIGLHDLKKNKRIFVTTVGMNSSIVGKDDEDTANNLTGMSSIYDIHIFTYTKLDDAVELPVENIISVVLGNNTGFVLRTINNPAEGRITLELKDKAAKAKIANMDSVYYNDNADIIFVRDMFGVPTPVQIEQ